MAKPSRRRTKKAGMPPGSLIHIGPETSAPVSVKTFQYTAESYNESSVTELEKCCSHQGQAGVTWIEVDGIHSSEVIEKLGKQMNLHPLVMEDIMNSTQRPKVEDYEDYYFIVLRMVQYDETERCMSAEQVSFIVGSNFVLTFQEREKDVFDKVRERIRSGKGKIRKQGSDYLAYALMDAIVDNYFIVLEAMGEELEALENELVSDPSRQTLNRIYDFKRSIMALRRAGWPLREIMLSLQRGDSGIIAEPTRLYFRDVYDHSVEIIDIIENLRDISSGMIDVYLSSMSNRLNEVMKVLTVITTIFMPLTFIAGVYGMNFKYMPELEWRWGYLVVLLLMAAIGIGMSYYFKKKRWF